MRHSKKSHWAKSNFQMENHWMLELWNIKFTILFAKATISKCTHTTLCMCTHARTKLHTHIYTHLNTHARSLSLAHSNVHQICHGKLLKIISIDHKCEATSTVVVLLLLCCYSMRQNARVYFSLSKVNIGQSVCAPNLLF